MGTDKAVVLVLGRPMASYALACLRQAGAAEVLAIGGDVVSLQTMGYHAVPEPRPAEGPLGGIVAALEVALAPLVAILACDMPLVRPATVTTLVRAATASVGSMAVANGRRQELLAVYPKAMLPPLRQAFEGGERAVHRAVTSLPFVEVVVAGEEATNLNSAADVARAERHLRRLGADPPEP